MNICRNRLASYIVLAFLGIASVGSFEGCGTASPRFKSGDGKSSETSSFRQSELSGIASYYADEFNGRRTANGEVYDMHALTSAHKTLPFGTKVRVTNLDNRRSVIVRINDRGPFKDGRVIDLSYAAAKEIYLISNGTAPVEIEILELAPNQ